MAISVLIPAYRATFLSQTIASILAQTYGDYELIISDDSPDDRVAEVVAEFKDKRISYSHTGCVGARENCRILWEKANHTRIKFVFDDDFLFPFALDVLQDALSQEPRASFSFFHRSIVDANGRILRQESPIQSNRPALITQEMMTSTMLRDVVNWIGEPSNVLINRAVGVSFEDFGAYQGYQLDMLNDVGLFVNAGYKGPSIGIPFHHSAFRQHGQQNSVAGFSPSYSSCVFEWELFIRGEFSRGVLIPDSAIKAIQRLEGNYRQFAATYPELLPFMNGLGKFRNQIIEGRSDVLDTDFGDAWRHAKQTITNRSVSTAHRVSPN